MTRIGVLSGRQIKRSFNPTLTFGQASERSSRIIGEKSKDLQKGFSAFRSAHADMKRERI